MKVSIATYDDALGDVQEQVAILAERNPPNAIVAADWRSADLRSCQKRGITRDRDGDYQRTQCHRPTTMSIRWMTAFAATRLRGRLRSRGASCGPARAYRGCAIGDVRFASAPRSTRPRLGWALFTAMLGKDSSPALLGSPGGSANHVFLSRSV